MTLDGAETVCH